MLLEVNGLNITAAEGQTRIVRGASFAVREKSICALVGGSGSGKTTSALAVTGLLPDGLCLESGSIRFKDQELTGLRPAQWRRVRGSEIAFVFQEPLYAFNPVFTIGAQIEEVLIYHSNLSRAQRQQRVLHMLDLAGIGDPGRVAANYPHQLSGGMRQRAMIAQALAGEPELIIADEPTSNLDVTLQARILELFGKLVKETGLAVLLITHDLGVVEHVSDDIVVMKKGEVIECGATGKVLAAPEHPYTRQLWEALETA